MAESPEDRDRVMFIRYPQETWEFNKPKNRLAVHNVIIKARVMFAVTPIALLNLLETCNTCRCFPEDPGYLPLPVPPFTDSSFCTVATARAGPPREAVTIWTFSQSDVPWNNCKNGEVFLAKLSMLENLSQSCCLLIRCVCKSLVWLIWLGLSEAKLRQAREEEKGKKSSKKTNISLFPNPSHLDIQYGDSKILIQQMCIWGCLMREETSPL